MIETGGIGDVDLSQREVPQDLRVDSDKTLMSTVVLLLQNCGTRINLIIKSNEALLVGRRPIGLYKADSTT